MTSKKASYTHNYQDIHQVALSTISLPTDAWIPCNALVKPQIRNQYAIGFIETINIMIETSIEIYFKDMKNLTEYKEVILHSPKLLRIRISIHPRQGYGYGIEFFFNKTKGRTNGLVGLYFMG